MLQGANMPRARRWLGAIRRIFAKSSCKTIAVLDHTNLIHGMPPEDHVDTMTPTEKLDFSEDESYEWKEEEELALEDFAAIKIQAHFRGHLARRAFRALRSLVKLQAVVRGMCVRKQMRVAIHFMQAMVRLQVRVRARRLPNNSEDAEVLQI